MNVPGLLALVWLGTVCLLLGATLMGVYVFDRITRALLRGPRGDVPGTDQAPQAEKAPGASRGPWTRRYRRTGKGALAGDEVQEVWRDGTLEARWVRKAGRAYFEAERLVPRPPAPERAKQ